MEIKREQYLQELIKRQWNGQVKVITGIRRCGKSYLLRPLFRNYLLANGVKEEQIIHLELDLTRNIRYRNPLELSSYIHKLVDGRKERFYLFIDEIQMCGKVKNPYLPDILTEFRGRGDEIRVHPLTFAEFYSAAGGSRQAAFDQYAFFGGMPLVLSQPDDGAKTAYLESLFSELYLKDIVERKKIEYPDVLGQLLDLLCSSIGSLTNPSKIANTIRSRKNVRVSENTLKSYLLFLEDAFLFSEHKRYDVKGKLYFEFPMKYYCEDIGLRNARLGFRQMEMTHIMENIICNELRARKFSVDVGVVYENGKNASGNFTRHPREIDFVATKGNRKFYIQSAFSISEDKKAKAELKPFELTGDSFPKIVVRHDIGKSWYDDNGILNINVVDFLLDTPYIS